MSAKTFSNLTSLKSGMKTNEVKFLDNDKTLPYVLGQDEQYYYFAKGGPVHFGLQSVTANPDFILLMTSSKDLGEAQ